MNLRVVSLFALTAAFLAAGASTDWPQWRGPNRDNVAKDSPPLAKSWPAGGPHKVWETHGLPEGGFGSVAVSGGACYVYIHANAKAKDIVVCLDAATGAKRWTQELKGASTLQDASSTPTVVGGKVYVTGARATYCLSAATGAPLWTSTYSPGRDWKTDQMEVASSFLVVGEAAVVCAGRPNGIDVRTGQVRWTGNDLGGNASGLASAAGWRAKGQEYALCCGVGLSCYDVYSGKEMWKLGGKGPVSYGSSPTVAGNDAVAIIDGQLCRVRMTPEKGEILWRSPFFDDFSSPLIANKHVYTVGPNKKPGPVVVACRDLGTGTIGWETPVASNEYSSPIFADGKLIVLVDKGATLMLLDANPKGTGAILASAKVGALKWVSPAFVDGKVYLHIQDGIVCYDLTAKGNAAK